MILARFNKQVIRPDFQAFGQVERKFNNSSVYIGLRQTLVFKPNSSNFISSSRKNSESVAFSTVNFSLLMLRVQNRKKLVAILVAIKNRAHIINISKIKSNAPKD